MANRTINRKEDKTMLKHEQEELMNLFLKGDGGNVIENLMEFNRLMMKYRSAKNFSVLEKPSVMKIFNKT